ncbi:MAG: glycosyltransferase family 9 protein [Planctomycetota bacterium]
MSDRDYFEIDPGAAPRFLITRLSHIGDCVLTLPVAAALKQRFPGCFVGWAVEKPSDQLIELSPDVDQVIQINRKWLKNPRGWARIRSLLKPFGFDCVIDPQSISKSSIVGRLSGARRRIGLGGKWSRELAPILNNRHINVRSSHLVDRSLEMLWPLGIESTPVNDSISFPMQPCDGSAAVVEDWMARSGFQRNQFVVINPGASWPSKRWETLRFGHVAAHIMKNYSLPSVVVWAGEEEKQMAAEICITAEEGCSGAATIAARTSLRELMELTRRASFFFGCDTGPLHISSAVETACVGLYGPTRPEDSGAYGTRHVALQAWYQEGTSRERRAAPNLAMRDISVEMAAAGCDRMMEKIVSRREAA